MMMSLDVSIMTKRRWLFILGFLCVAGLAVGLYLYQNLVNVHSDSNDYIAEWLNNPASRAELVTTHACEDAPFLLPSTGFIGLLYRDVARPYNGLSRHTGIDIFGDGDLGTVPIFAAYDGYLTRLNDWRATVIIRHDDPLIPGRTIWTYYTHMANLDGSVSFIVEDFPPGTTDQFVERGTLLGYQGNYNGGRFDIAMHLHFSIVKSNKDGTFKNEAILRNTLDPSPYFGLPLDLNARATRPIQCKTDS